MAQFRHYHADDVAAFHRVRDPYGMFSNMAAGYPLRVGGIQATSSEAAYQALRFPDLPEFQAEILVLGNPILAKRHAYTRIAETRLDWDAVKVNIMRYVLRAKFCSQQEALLPALAETGDRPIVEVSLRDDFWGAKPDGERLVGRNVLGRLLMELRAELAAHPVGGSVEVAPHFPCAKLLAHQLGEERFPPDSEPAQDPVFL